MDNRQQWLDTAKGFAILLVVMGHVLRGFTTANMFGEYGDVLKYLDYTIYSFHMPLFFAISGFLYAQREQLGSLSEYGSFVTKKLIRLGIPYIIFSLLQGLVRLKMSGQTNHDFGIQSLIAIPWQPFDQFWFLFALLVISLVIPLMEKLLKSDMLVFALLIVLTGLSRVVVTNIPAVDFLMAKAVYYYSGAMAARYLMTQLDNTKFLVAGTLAYLIMNPLLYPFKDAPYIFQLDRLALGFTGCIMAVGLLRRVIPRVSAWDKGFFFLGLYSFEIFLLHTIPAAAARIILIKKGITGFAPHLLLAMLLGVFIPVIVGMIAKKVPPLEALFYPGKYLKFKSKKKATVPA